MKRCITALVAAGALFLAACDEDATTTTGHAQAGPLSELVRLAQTGGRDRNPMRLRTRGTALQAGAQVGELICQAGEGRTSKLVGLTVRRATARVERGGCTLRVVRENGRDLLYTGDFRQDRINVAVRDGHVSRLIGTF